MLCALLLTGCAGTLPRALQQEVSAHHLPAAVELDTTPFFPQSRHQCGPAALATVLAARGVDVTPDGLSDRLYIPALRGSLQPEIAATARHYGMLVYPLQTSIADLLAEVAHGNPVLVFQNLGLRWLPRLHYAVVIGYDLDAGEVVLRSGTTRRWRTTLATFERTWARGDHWARVIVPAGDIPATAQANPYLRAAHDLEAGKLDNAARGAYAAATRRWPDTALVWMAYGNNRYTAADHATARDAFLRATRLAPEAPDGWNNLAYALLQTGCPQQARRAAHCAVRLAPDAVAYRDTLAEIETGATGADGPHCTVIHCGVTAE